MPTRKFHVQIQHSTHQRTRYISVQKVPGRIFPVLQGRNRATTLQIQHFCCEFPRSSLLLHFPVKVLNCKCCVLLEVNFQFGQWINSLGLGLQSPCSFIEEKPKGEVSNTEDWFEQDFILVKNVKQALDLRSYSHTGL